MQKYMTMLMEILLLILNKEELIRDMRKVEEIIHKRYKNNIIYTTTIIEFHYNTESDKIKHSKEMQKQGFTDNGDRIKNLGTLTEPDFVWFGRYYKDEYETE